MGQLLQVTLLQKNNNVLLEPQLTLINAGRINFVEDDDSGSKILYGSGYGVAQDTLIVEESYVTIQAAIESYEPGKNIEVPVVKVDNNVRSFIATIAAPGISYVSVDTDDPTHSLILYVEPNKITFRYYVVDLTFSELQTLVDGGNAIWGQITGTLSNQTDLQAALNAKGTVNSVSVATNQGVSGVVASPTTTPAITLSLGALTGVNSLNGMVVTADTGVITTGTWNASLIDPQHGGTGVDNQTRTITINTNNAAFTFSSAATLTIPATGTAFLSGGLAGGQTATGGTAASQSLTLSSTANATKGTIIFGTSKYDEVNNRLGINVTPLSKLHIKGSDINNGTYSIRLDDSTGTQQFQVDNQGLIVAGNTTAANTSHLFGVAAQQGIYLMKRGGTTATATDLLADITRNTDAGEFSLYDSSAVKTIHLYAGDGANWVNNTNCVFSVGATSGAGRFNVKSFGSTSATWTVELLNNAGDLSLKVRDDRNFAFLSEQYGSGEGVFSIGNAITNPSTNPTNAIVNYVDAADGVWKYRDENGNVVSL